VAAVRMDSSFALAALRGAQAADWLSAPDQDSALVEIALSHSASLPLLQLTVARGLRAYVIGNADSAIYYFQRALALEPRSSQTWTMLGEVYARMLPSRGPADSLSKDAFERARSLDADFAPALLQLERLALRGGDLAAMRRLAAELKVANADTSHASARRLMTRCLEEGPAAVDWSAAVRTDVEAVLTAGKLFSAGASQPECGSAALRAILAGDSVSRAYRWVSLLALEGIDEALAAEQPTFLFGRCPP
jgi:tetratricopeptide (TPR) repeat protein